MAYLHSYALNFYEMFYEVRQSLSETTAAFWTDLEIYNKLNQGQANIVAKSRCLKKTVTVTTTEDTQEYDLRTSTNSFADIIDIAEDGVYYYQNATTKQKLRYKTIPQLDKEFPGWRSVSASTPQYYYYNKATKTIGLYPKPNSTNAGAYLYITGYYKPKILHAGTAAAGATSSITLAAGSTTAPYVNPTNDYYNDLYIEIYSGTGIGQKAKITDYVGSTRVCSATFSTAPDNTSVYGMIPEIPEEAHYLMPIFALWRLWAKGGSRTVLANNYRQEYLIGLGDFIGETIEEQDEELVKDTYR